MRIMTVIKIMPPVHGPCGNSNDPRLAPAILARAAVQNGTVNVNV